MIKNLQHKKCLITGAASGIGRAVAFAAAKEGAILFLTDINAQQLADVVIQLEQQGANVGYWQALDISDLTQVQQFSQQIHEQYAAMDVVMNIAGIAIWGAVENLQHQQWQKVIDVNLMGAIHIIENFIPQMIKQGQGGHLVNVSSAAGLFGLPWHVAYSASKFGLRGVSEVLRFDLKCHRIGVSLVCPGAVNTGLVETLQVANITMNQPQVQKIKKYFQKVAVSPEKAAQAIIRGIKKNQYMVFTSRDIQLAFWLQNISPTSYRFVMQKMNDLFHQSIA